MASAAAAAAASAATAVLYRFRNIEVHAAHHLPPMSLLLSLVPGSRFDLLMSSPGPDEAPSAPPPVPDRVSGPFAPPPIPEKVSAPCAPPPVPYRVSALCAARPREAGVSASAFIFRLPRTRIGRNYECISQTPGARGFSTIGPRPVRAVYSEMGTNSFERDPNDIWIRMDRYMDENHAFELIKGHPLILDSFKGTMWQGKSRSVLENLLWLDLSNCIHGVSIAPALFPENIMVAKKSSSVRLIIPEGVSIDGVTCFTSDGLQAGCKMYFAEALKHQSSSDIPLDAVAFFREVQGCFRVMLTREQYENILRDAVFLDESAMTALLDQSSLLLRVAYLYSNVQEDIDCRRDALLELRRSSCRDGNVFETYLLKNSVPISSHFHAVTLGKSQGHRAKLQRYHPAEAAILTEIQEGHDQLGSLRHTCWHVNDKNNLPSFQKHIGPRTQLVIKAGGNQQVNYPPQLVTPLVQNPNAPVLNFVSSNDLAKYHHFHFPMTSGTIMKSMDKEPQSREDLNARSLFHSNRKPNI